MSKCNVYCLTCGKHLQDLPGDEYDKAVTWDECDGCVYERHQSERGECDCDICVAFMEVQQ